jgi:vacuolar protein sorting-associated protein 13A/C
MDQSVDVKISTFVFRADPEPVISLYDFIMKTFVPKDETATATTPEEKQSELVDNNQDDAQSSKIKVLVNLASVQGRNI